MKTYPTLIAFLVTCLPLLVGCGEDFPTEEMDLGDEPKTRPLAILCEPAEVAPGDTVTVTLLYYEPFKSHPTVHWWVALDYDLGLYQADEVERLVHSLTGAIPIPAPAGDGRGFLTQTFRYGVPDSTILWSSSIPEQIEDEGLVLLAREILPGAAETGVTKSAVDAFLRSLTAEDLAALDPVARETVLRLADLFAVEIRFRARPESDLLLDITRNITVRYSGRLGSANTNLNPQITGFDLVVIPHPDVEWDDKDLYADELQRHPFVAGAGSLPEVSVPRHAGWTYYVTLDLLSQEYTSPFSWGRLLEEDESYRWYYFRIGDPADMHALFRDDAGEETEMFSLDSSVRLEPPPGEEDARFRIIGCVRDERPEWEHYNTVPGATLAIGEVVFTAP